MKNKNKSSAILCDLRVLPEAIRAFQHPERRKPVQWFWYLFCVLGLLGFVASVGLLLWLDFLWIPALTLIATAFGSILLGLTAFLEIANPAQPPQPEKKRSQMPPKPAFGPRLSRCICIVLLIICAGLFLFAYGQAQNVRTLPQSKEEASLRFEKAKVLAVAGTYQGSQEYEDIPVGEQILRVLLTTGPKKGTIMDNVHNPLIAGPSSGTVLKEGDTVILNLSYDDNGEIEEQPVFYCDYDRSTPLFIILGLFILLTIVVGGKTGAKSLLGLCLTVLYIFAVLIPLLLGGADTLPSIFAMCALVTVVEFLILDGFNKKTVCAILGTLSGVLFAMLFAMLSGHLLRTNGYAIKDAEALIDDLWNTKRYQVMFYGASIQLSDLLIGGVVIAALGAVNDVAMSISSSMNELTVVNPDLTHRQLLRSGMNIGRDMVGTMTNTLILALAGSSLVLIIHLVTRSLSFNQLFSGTLVSVEMIQALASSIGVIMAVPFTVVIGMFLYGKKAKAK